MKLHTRELTRESQRNDWANRRSQIQPYNYWRYADDIWGLWTQEGDALRQILKQTNTLELRMEVESRGHNKQNWSFLIQQRNWKAIE